MGKKYEPVGNESRQQLIELIHNKGYSIANAAKQVGIYYPTAKAINKVYQRENRSNKKAIRLRQGKPQLNQQRISGLQQTQSISKPLLVCGIRKVDRVLGMSQKRMGNQTLQIEKESMRYVDDSSYSNFEQLQNCEMSTSQSLLEEPKARFDFYNYSEQIALKLKNVKIPQGNQPSLTLKEYEKIHEKERKLNNESNLFANAQAQQFFSSEEIELENEQNSSTNTHSFISPDIRDKKFRKASKLGNKAEFQKRNGVMELNEENNTSSLWCQPKFKIIATQPIMAPYQKVAIYQMRTNLCFGVRIQ